jgi:hypothetical protein
VFVVLGATDRPNAPSQPTNDPGEAWLYREMRERIAYLERQVEEREARCRADNLLARLMDRLPELEAPSEAEAAEVPEAASGEPEGVETPARCPGPAGGRTEAVVAPRYRASSTLNRHGTGNLRYNLNVPVKGKPAARRGRKAYGPLTRR